MTHPTLSRTAEHWRSRLLLLRAHMAPAVVPEDIALAEALSRNGSDVDWAELFELDPDRRLVNLDLLQDGRPIGQWTMTGRELGLAWDPEVMIRLKHRFPTRLRSIVGLLAARGAEVLSSWTPKLITRMKADSLRRDYTPDLALPFAVAGGLHTLLEREAPDRRVIWLAIDEPAGYIPHLNWERLLRPHVNVPIVRLPARLVDPTSPRQTLDVLMTCSTASTRLMAAPTRVVQLIKQIVSAVPAPHRCVVHLFADEVYRPVLLAALNRSKVAVREYGEPDGQRGVIVYPHAEKHRPAEENNDSTQLIEHPWGLWVTQSLAGKAVDVVHVIADGDLSPSIASLRVSELPWGSTEECDPAPKTESESKLMRIPFFQSKPKRERAVVIRYVDAIQMRDFGKHVGAWATVVSSAQESARVAHRVLVHRLAQIATGLFALHEFDSDSKQTAAGSFYRMLLVGRESGGDKGDNPQSFIPDNPTLSFYCHPDRVPDGIASSKQTLGDLLPSAHAAVDRIAKWMDEPEPTPAWLAVTQRHIENTAADWAHAGSETDRDLAGREGVLDALEFALKAIAENSRSSPSSAENVERPKGAAE